MARRLAWISGKGDEYFTQGSEGESDEISDELFNAAAEVVTAISQD
jgi:hypothetical protein